MAVHARHQLLLLPTHNSQLQQHLPATAASAQHQV